MPPLRIFFKDGNKALTSEHVMVVSYLPPRVMIAISPECDTYKNIQSGSDCVVGFPRAEHIQVAYDAGV